MIDLVLLIARLLFVALLYLFLFAIMQSYSKIIGHCAFLQIQLLAYIIFKFINAPKFTCNLVDIKQSFIECVCTLQYFIMMGKLYCKKCIQGCLVKLVRCQWTNYNIFRISDIGEICDRTIFGEIRGCTKVILPCEIECFHSFQLRFRKTF